MPSAAEDHHHHHHRHLPPAFVKETIKRRAAAAGRVGSGAFGRPEAPERPPPPLLLWWGQPPPNAPRLQIPAPSPRALPSPKLSRPHTHQPTPSPRRAALFARRAALFLLLVFSPPPTSLPPPPLSRLRGFVELARPRLKAPRRPADPQAREWGPLQATAARARPVQPARSDRRTAPRLAPPVLEFAPAAASAGAPPALPASAASRSG